MADEPQEIIVELKHDYYRDGYHQATIALILIGMTFILMCAVSIWLMFVKSPPVTFVTDNDWRVVTPVPVTEAYPNQADLIQWVANALIKVFSVDFVSYAQEMNANKSVFTDNGWKSFLEQTNSYIGQSIVANGQWFVNGGAAGAPVIMNQGLYQGSYGWWIQMPLNLSYSGAVNGNTIPLIVQALVVRVSTMNDLRGVRIEAIVLKKGEGEQIVA